MSFEVFVPADPEGCFDGDMHAVKTRDWAVPGEMLYFFVKTSPSVLQLDAITFSAYISRKTVRSRRSTLANTLAPTLSPEKYVDLEATTTYHRFPSMKPFRMESGHGIYPLCVKIPTEMTVPFIVEVFIPRKATPITKVEMRSVLPFMVTWAVHVTTVSLVAEFTTAVTLKGAMEPLVVENTHATFCVKPANSGEDVASNVEIIKPQNGVATVTDEETVSSVFIMKPLTETGASLIANNTLQYMVDWRCGSLRYTCHYSVDVSNQALGFALLMPPVATEVMSAVTVPMRITNVRNVNQGIDLVFEGGPIQPAVQRVRLPELKIGESCTIDVSLLPLVVGYHKFSFWAETDDGTKIHPLFPTYIRVIAKSV